MQKYRYSFYFNAITLCGSLTISSDTKLLFYYLLHVGTIRQKERLSTRSTRTVSWLDRFVTNSPYHLKCSNCCPDCGCFLKLFCAWFFLLTSHWRLTFTFVNNWLLSRTKVLDCWWANCRLLWMRMPLRTTPSSSTYFNMLDFKIFAFVRYSSGTKLHMNSCMYEWFTNHSLFSYHADNRNFSSCSSKRKASKDQRRQQREVRKNYRFLLWTLYIVFLNAWVMLLAAHVCLKHPCLHSFAQNRIKSWKHFPTQDGIFFPPKRELPAGTPGSRRPSKKELKRQAIEGKSASNSVEAACNAEAMIADKETV